MWFVALNVWVSPASASPCAPYIYDPYEARFVSCSDEREVDVDLPRVKSCGKKLKLSGAVTSAGGAPANLPLVKGEVTVPIGEHTITWTLADAWGTVLDTAEQTLVLQPAIAGLSVLEFNDRAHTDALVASYDFTEIGVDAYTGTILSVGDVWLRERAAVYGDLLTGGILDTQNDTYVEGDTQTGLADVGLPWLYFHDWDEPAGAVDVIVDAGVVTVLSPGAYGELIVHADGWLVLEDGDYTVENFTVDTGGLLSTARTEVYVHGDFTFRGSQPDGNPFIVSLTGAGSANVEADFYGVVEAPYGNVTLASGGHTYTGRFVGLDVMFGEDAWIMCDEVCEDY